MRTKWVNNIEWDDNGGGGDDDDSDDDREVWDQDSTGQTPRSSQLCVHVG